jgi:hypothetical protein
VSLEEVFLFVRVIKARDNMLQSVDENGIDNQWIELWQQFKVDLPVIFYTIVFLECIISRRVYSLFSNNSEWFMWFDC